MLFLLLFLFSTLAAEENLSPIAHFEAGVPCIAGGCVNVITGGPVISDNDLTFYGIEPYSFTRHVHYEPDVGSQFIKSWDYDFLELLRVDEFYREETGRRETPNPKYESALSLERGSQTLLSFQYDWGARETKAFFDSVKDAKGSTNLASGRPSGQTNLKNIFMERARRRGAPCQKATISFGSGERREYEGKNTAVFDLQWVVHPSGFKEHHFNEGSRVVEFVSPSGKKIGAVSKKYERKGTDFTDRLETEDGRQALLSYKIDDHGRASFRHLLTNVQRTDRPSVSYTYHPSLKNKQLAEIFYPEKRGVSFSYWKEGDIWVDKNYKTTLSKEASQNFKIKEILQPIDADGKRVKTHLLQYFRNHKDDFKWTEGLTRVVIGNGHFDEYIFDRKFLIQEVRHYSNPYKTNKVALIPDASPYPCDLREKFFWNAGGEIKTIAHSDGNGVPLRVKHYLYDSRGNITEETLFGPVSGLSDILPSLDSSGNPLLNGCESYKKTFTYSDDGFNLTTSETAPSGLKITYSYIQGTNLLSEKTTSSREGPILKEVFTYDEDNCLIQKEEISTHLHRKEKIVPLKVTPFGYPQERFIFAVGEEGEELIESYAYLYNTRGDVLKEERKDSKGTILSSIQRQFDAHGNCLIETNHLGYQIERTFDANDNCIQEIGPRPGLKKIFRHDYMNRCVQEQILFGDQSWSLHNSYNILNQKERVRDFFDREIETTFDRYGRPIQVKLPSVETGDGMVRPTIKKSFDPFGNPTETTDPLGYKTTKKFTAHDKCSEVIHPDGGIEKFFYSTEGWLIKSIDLEGVETSFFYDAYGREARKETPFGTEQSFYEGIHLVKKIDVAGLETSFAYDSLGRLTETTCCNRRERVSYDSLGHPYRKEHFDEDTLLSTHVSKVDALGRTIESYLEDPSGQIFNHKKYIYDEANNCIEEWNGASKIRREFDGLNRLTSVVDNEGNQHRLFYTLVSQALEKTVVDPKGQQIITLYDSLDREATIRHLNPIGFEIKTKKITYDLAGHVIKEETASKEGSRLLLKEVDCRGRVTTLLEPLKKVTHMSYTKSGALSQLTKPDGVKLLHTYEEGRLQSLRSSDGKLSYLYTYSPRGELLAVYDEISGTLSRQAFSLLGDLVEETLPTGQTITYQHDSLGRVVNYSLPDGGQVCQTHNARAVTSVSRYHLNGDLLYRHNYLTFDGLGNVTDEQLIDGSHLRSTFDDLYQLTALQHRQIKEENFVYDAVGNLLSFDQQGEHKTYRYDDLYQLTEENDHQYSYDPFHNRLSKDGSTYALNELDQLLSQSDSTYTYDLNGNLTRLEKANELFLFTYDPLNRLLSITKNNASVAYTYDPFNRRITRNNVPFYFYKDQEIGSPTELRILGPGLGGDIGATIAIEIEEQIFTPLHDHQGNIIGLTSLEGELLSSWNFTAYGELIGETSSPWAYASKRTEPLTSWISFPRRDYDPTTGRWTTADPLGHAGGPNLYAYVSNRPIYHRDPLGLHPDEVWRASDDPFHEIKAFLWDRGAQALDMLTMQLDSYIDITASFLEDEEDRYPDKSCLYLDLIDLANLPENSLIVVLTNGMANSFSEFQETCVAVKDWGFNVVGMYNPSHGPGLIGRIRDGIRAFKGARGDESKHRQLVNEFHNFWKNLFLISPEDSRYLCVAHSEGNIIQTRAIRTLSEGMRNKIDYFGIASPAYLEKGNCRNEIYLETNRDCIPVANFYERKRVLSEKICIVKSIESMSILDHSFFSNSLNSYLIKGIENYQNSGKLDII